jgi:hypothetical protein
LVDPDYPVGTGPSLWDRFVEHFSERPIAWAWVISDTFRVVVGLLRGDSEIIALIIGRKDEK